MLRLLAPCWDVCLNMKGRGRGGCVSRLELVKTTLKGPKQVDTHAFMPPPPHDLYGLLQGRRGDGQVVHGNQSVRADETGPCSLFAIQFQSNAPPWSKGFVMGLGGCALQSRLLPRLA